MDDIERTRTCHQCTQALERRIQIDVYLNQNHQLDSSHHVRHRVRKMIPDTRRGHRYTPFDQSASIVWLKLQGQNTKDVNRFTFGVLVGLPTTIVMLSIIYLAPIIHCIFHWPSR